MIRLASLYGKMALLLFLLLLILGAAFLWLLSHTSRSYQQEVMQKLNVDLAQHLVESDSLLANGKVNQQALEHLFHLLMVINPSIEVYLLDPKGKLLAYSAPAGKVVRENVDLAPIRKFITGNNEYPLKGDDPRSLDGSKVFSASPIRRNDQLQGYLYVILGSQAYDGIASQIANSYALRVAAGVLLSALSISLLFGLGGFAFITRRLRLLARIMRNNSPGKVSGHPPRYPERARKHPDEIEILGRSFNTMADRIDNQMQALTRNDAQRREMIANISHDLRTPLTSLHGYLETLLLKDPQLNAEERQRYLRIANKQSHQLIRLVSELFELAKLDSCETMINIEAFSLAELVQDVVNKFRLKAGKKQIELRVNCPPSLPFAYGDIGLIQRVLDNLIENALQHTPENGQVRVSLTSDHKNIAVEISDTGCGIPGEELPHIFDRFYRLDKSRRPGDLHAGLGLAIAKRILELHNGHIWARSGLNQGTTFGFQFSAQPFVTEM
ncbi:sensor histidine kinase [Thiolapillus sp.]